MLLGEVVRLRPVGVGVVELPDVVVEGRHDGVDAGLPRRAVLGHRGPALVVDAAVAEHLEVLRLVALGGVGVVEAVGHADALDRLLLHPVDHHRRRQPGHLEHRRGDVDDVVELRAHLALAVMPPGQWTIVPLRVPPQCDATCLVHWYGVSIACAQPTA